MRVIPSSSLSKHPMPTIILIKGQPGSGKSTLSKALATKLQWPLIDKDDARDTLQLVAPTAPQFLDWNSLSYELFFNFAHAQLKCGLSIILDCPFARQSLYDRVKLFADQYKATIVLVECCPTDLNTWRLRLESRGSTDITSPTKNHKPCSWEDVEFIIKRNNGSESWSDGITEDKIVLDTTAMSIEGQVEVVMRAVREKVRGS